MQERDAELLKTINEWVRINGGAKVLADVIISENHDIYQSESVGADRRLKQMGIISSNDIEPFDAKKKGNYNYQAILLMYPHYSYSQMAEELGKPLQYIQMSVNHLINTGRLVRKPIEYPSWTKEEDEFIIKNARFMNNEKISKSLRRTENAIGNRKTLLGIGLEEKYKGLSGRWSHKYNNQS
jgi:hypothetical protein